MTAKKGKTPPQPTAGEDKCSLCHGSICCTYITQPLDTPRSMRDFDHILWQVSHHNVSVYKDEDGWYLLVAQSCAHLLPGGACGIYDERPLICREHTNDYCEYDSPAEEGFELYFDSYESLQKYCRKRFKNWKKRFKG